MTKVIVKVGGPRCYEVLVRNGKEHENRDVWARSREEAAAKALGARTFEKAQAKKKIHINVDGKSYHGSVRKDKVNGDHLLIWKVE